MARCGAALLAPLALLCLAACVPTAAVSVTATATASPTTVPVIPTATLSPAATPTNVPAGWSVLADPAFSIAYPPQWSVRNPSTNTGAAIYLLTPPTPDNQGVEVVLYQASQSSVSADFAPYCLPGSQGDVQRVSLAGLQMSYIPVSGEGGFMRSWTFVNAQRTMYTLNALDIQGTSTAQAQDDRILATFRPDNAAPWNC